MKTVLLFLNATMALASSAADLAEDLWFFEDFDRPAVMNGEMIEHEVPGDAIVPGRFGKACFFRRKSSNVLLPMSDFVSATNTFEGIGGTKVIADPAAGTLAFAGGEMRILPQPVGVPETWATKMVSSTFSMEVKGAKGTELVLAPEITELTDKHVETLKKNDRDFTRETCRTNVVNAKTFRLTGEWQRVWNYGSMDIRTRFVRKVGWRIKAGGPVTMRKFQQQGTGFSVYAGILQPTEWVDGGNTREEYHLKVTDQAKLVGFPCSNGTFACWMRTPDDWVPESKSMPVFIYQPGWDRMWSYTGNAFSTAKGYGPAVTGFSKVHYRTNAWAHLAATWNHGEVVIYYNGEEVARREKPLLQDMRQLKGAFLIGGCGTDGSCDAELDEVAFFKRALHADEVRALFTAKQGLLAGGTQFLASPPVFTAFPRNCTNAAVKFAVDAPVAGECTLDGEVGGQVLPKCAVKLAAGANSLALPFRAADFTPGKYPWRVRLLGKDGRAVLAREGELAILGRVERDSFSIRSTFSGDRRELDLLKTIGIDTTCVNDDNRTAAAVAENAGMRLDLRLENAWEWRRENFDFARIAAKVEKRLGPYAGDPLWISTIVNSEVYGPQSADQAIRHAAWREIAKKELGHDPVVGFTSMPCGVDWAKHGLQYPRGVMERTDLYDTLVWFMRRGMPQLMMSRLDADVIRRLSPGNVVWSEPSPSMENLDMSADWIYSYSPWACLYFLRHYEMVPRAAKVKYMPFLAMGYWSPDFMEVTTPHPTQKDPESGKNVPTMMCQTADELAIKSMMCIGGSSAESLSFFSVNWCWGQSTTNGVLHEKGLPLVLCPGWGKYCVAEKDAPERFGAFVRERFVPAATLLRGIPAVKSPVAVLLPKEIDYSGEFWWPRVTYLRQLGPLLAQRPVPFDMLSDGDFTLENLSQYDYIFYPQLNCVTPGHDKVLRALPATTKLLHDDNTFRAQKELAYPNWEHVKGLSMHFPAEAKNLDIPMDAWLGPKVGDLRKKLYAWSEQDGTNAFTLVKEFKGVHYVTVINNLRREGGCPQTDIFTNAWYRPMGAPQMIVTHFPHKGVIYAFNSGRATVKRDRGSTVEVPYASAESKTFCVYPKELGKPGLELAGRPQAGGEANLAVTINDIDGKPAPGRQVVRLDLTDPDGKVCDESGLYPVEDGRTEITLRFARDAKEGGFFSKWKAVVTDLTTGHSESVTFKVENRGRSK